MITQFLLKLHHETYDMNLVILFNGFSKKSQKTPRSELEKAIRLKNEYYADKRSQD